MRTVAALIAIAGILLSGSSCAANQYAPTTMLSAELSVDLSHGGIKETWRVVAKLSEDRRTLASLVAQSPRMRIEIPKELIGDIDRPDLSSIQVMTEDP